MTKVAITKPEGKRTVLSKAVGEAGRPLPEPIRVDLEIKFSANLKGVRIHTGPLGDEVAKSLDAEAVTLGQHIFFQTGKWNPETAEGMDLLVHETAHTLQHAGPTLNQPETSVTQPGDVVERAADAWASEGNAGKEKAALRPIPEATAARRVAGIAPREKKAADPARTIEELGRALLLRTRADSHDRSGRIRNQLIRMEDNLRRDVLRWLENHMESHDWRSFVHLLAEEPPAGTEGTEDAQAKEEAKTKPAEGEAETGTPQTEQAPDGEAAAAEAGKKEPGKGEATKDQPEVAKAADKAASGRQMSPEEAAVEDAATEGKDGPQEADVAKPSIAAAGGEEASAEGGEAGGGPAAAPRQTQAAAAPAISAAPAAAEEPAGSGAAAGAAATSQEDDQSSHGEAVSGRSQEKSRSGEPVGGRPEEASRIEEASAERSESRAPEPGDAAAERSTKAAKQASLAPQSESSALQDVTTASDPQSDPPTGSYAASSESDTGPTTASAASEAVETSSPDASASTAEQGPQPAAASPTAELATETPAPSPEPVTAPAATAPASEPAPETPATPTASEPAEPTAAASTTGVEIASGSQASIPETPLEPSAEAAQAAEAASPEPEVSDVASGRGAGPAASGAAAGGGVEQAGSASAPAALPPTLLGEFAGEPSEAEPAGTTGGGGGGGGGGAAAAAPPPPPEAAEDVIPAGDPAGAMQAVGSMKVGPASRAMGAAATTVSARTDQQRGDLASAPPTIERPTGAPQGAPGSTAGNVKKSPPGGAAKAAAAVAAGAPVSIAAPLAAPAPGPSVTQKVAPPRVTGTAEGKLSQADVERIRESVGEVPVTDEALNVSAGEAPALPLEGDADPALADKQQSALMDSAATNLQEGGEEAAAPMGEDHIYPKVEPGTITPDAAGSCDCGGGQKSNAASGDGPKGEAGPELGIEAVAEQESGDQVRQAANDGAGDIAQKQIDQEKEETDAHATSQNDVTAAIEENANQQSTERTNARKEVQEARKDWTEGQQVAVDTAQKDSDKAVTDAHGDISQTQKDATKEADGHINDGNKKIEKARFDSEQKARAEKARAEKEDDDGGIFSWVASKVSSFFSALRDAIHAVFDIARKIVSEAIDLAQKLAHEVIDIARKAIVGLIQIAGKALAAVGDVLLAAFPKLRAKFRAAIEEAVDSAVSTVNKLADALEAGIKFLLNGLLTALNAILCAYETLLNAIVDKVASAVNGAIAAARAIVAAFKMFAALVGDIAAGPGQWLSNLAASVMDGIKNHLWTALKLAVRIWFNDMVEGVIGMGKMLLNLLLKGGLSLKKIAGFVWQALVSALPGIIIQFLIEKLIAMIIPAAGAIVAVIQGLMAAWGAIQRIIAAFQLFFIFLKAVKNGGAGPQFATALAASAIAVLQFLANFLIARLGKAAGGVTSKLKALAQKIMAFFKRVGKGAMKVIRKVGGVILRGAKAVGRVIKRGVKVVGRVIKRGIKAVGRVVRRVLSKTKLGRKILSTYDSAKKKIAEYRDKFRKWREARKEKKKTASAERVGRALTELPPRIEGMAQRGVRGLLLRARLFAWKIQYRLSKLHLSKQGHGFSLVAAASPPQTTSLGLIDLPDEFLRDVVRSAVDKVMLSPEVERAELHIARQAPHGQTALPFADEIEMSHPAHSLGYILHFSSAETKVLRGAAQRRVRFPLSGGGAASSFETGPKPSWGRRPNPTILNQIVGSQSSYPQISRRLSDVAKSRGMSESAVWGEYDRFVRHGIAPPGGRIQADLFADMHLLTTMREGIRSSALAPAESAFASELIANNRLTPSQLLSRDPGVNGFSMIPKDANPQFRESERERFRQTFSYRHDPFDPAETNNPEQAMRRFYRSPNQDELREDHRNFRVREADAHWKSTPIGQHLARAEDPAARPPNAHWGGSNSSAERRTAALTREWLRLRSENWEFTDLASAREVILQLVIGRMRDHYRLDDFAEPPTSAPVADERQLTLPMPKPRPPSRQLELPIGK